MGKMLSNNMLFIIVQQFHCYTDVRREILHSDSWGSYAQSPDIVARHRNSILLLECKSTVLGVGMRIMFEEPDLRVCVDRVLQQTEALISFEISAFLYSFYWTKGKLIATRAQACWAAGCGWRTARHNISGKIFSVDAAKLAVAGNLSILHMFCGNSVYNWNKFAGMEA